MAFTPTTSAVVETKQLQEIINKQRNDISELRLQLKGLISTQQLALRAMNAPTKIQRMREQTEKLSATLEGLERGCNFCDKQFASFFSFLETQVGISAMETGMLYDKIRSSQVENIGNSGEQIFRAVAINSDLMQESDAVRFAEEFLRMRRTIECSRTESISLEEETEEMIEKQKREKQLYAEFAEETDRAREELKELVRKKEMKRDTVVAEADELESESTVLDVCSKMEKLKAASKFIKEKSEGNPLLQNVAVFLATLQSPSHSEEQIRSALDDMIAVARMQASTEVPVEPEPVRRPKPANLNKTLEELKARIAAHKPKL